MDQGRVPDPVGVVPDPDPTLEGHPDLLTETGSTTLLNSQIQCVHLNIRKTVTAHASFVYSMVLVLDGNPEIGAHVRNNVRNNLGYLIC